MPGPRQLPSGSLPACRQAFLVEAPSGALDSGSQKQRQGHFWPEPSRHPGAQNLLVGSSPRDRHLHGRRHVGARPAAQGAGGGLRLRGGLGPSPGPRPRRRERAGAVGPRRRGRGLRPGPRRRAAQQCPPCAPAAQAARRVVAGSAGRHLRCAGQLRARPGGVRRPGPSLHRRRNRSAVPEGRPCARGGGHALHPRGQGPGLVRARGHPLREGLLGRVRQPRVPLRGRGHPPAGAGEGVGHGPGPPAAAAAAARLSPVPAPREGGAARPRGREHQEGASREACRARGPRQGRGLGGWPAGVCRACPAVLVRKPARLCPVGCRPPDGSPRTEDLHTGSVRYQAPQLPT
ncbi:unnamed protein product [Prorocentrum cordatum]|uniref:Uncharacterized protein n=1 Tax=Prorocentrum cordatum TaxID=2364126 RepID=A0ABN9QJD7_9DINO|nr:unnamed protein product [Polarella glacialis]